ncbi:nucleotidyltransferase domain-containing protein [Saxibacter everestensis]|uniref:Nucleotidyltransferase domain-containing protein n=1 Tax=Saxibacter everestensis TaxID=2909229 RepID=A0ABY8QQQ2_9MICO|nr:nucleotidyltransferase domain-containing protein [Brevibacteriaceae bacterium ZFBP1038]
MADPDEGLMPDGTIRTGAQRERVPPLFEPILAEATRAAEQRGGSLYLYGSVATGAARPGLSDVDLLSVDFGEAATLGDQLSAKYADRCRAVEIATATAADFERQNDAAYGNRVFIRHYCVHLTGPDRSATLPAYPADARAARGFNGDIGQHLQRWRQLLGSSPQQVEVLGRRVARKSLLAVAGLVSVHDGTWTTDRPPALRWGGVQPELAADLAQLMSWADGGSRPTPLDVQKAVADGGIVPTIVEDFARLVGLWREAPDSPSTR